MADRSIKVILRAEVAGYKAAMRQAAEATRKVPEEGKKATTVLGGLVQSAEKNGAAWNTAGRALVGFGAAVTGVGVAAVSTGIAYNTLQQTSRAALTTLLGSAQAANAQMDKLDSFARTSPFSKAVFIQAQQQLIGFGMSAEKVLPTLDAIQNAVAATGGSSNEISQITDIIAKISSSAKITATDLQRFGTYGVDAATLIGSAMGLTGAQIRDKITEGSLDAGAALDALASGMGARFDGAADGVKDTFVGAVDRVKAAWREFGAMLAEPLVSQDGGGFLVDLLNNTADAMRAFEALPEPVKASAVAIAGVTGAAALASGAFLLMGPQIVAVRAAFGVLAQDLPRLTALARGTAVALTGIGVAAGTTIASTIAGGAAVEALISDKNVPKANALAAAIRAVGEEGKGVGDLGGQFSDWGSILGMQIKPVDDLAGAFDAILKPSTAQRFQGFMGKIPGFTSNIERIEERVAGLDAALVSMIQAGDADAVAAFHEGLLEMGYSAEDLSRLLPETQDAMIGVDEAAKSAGEGAADLAAGADAAAAAAEAAAEAYTQWAEEINTASGSFVNINGAFADATQAAQDWAQGQADAFGAAEQSWEDFYEGVSVGDWIAQLNAQNEALANWQANVLAITSEVRDQMPADMVEAVDGMVDELMRAGPEGAAALQLFRDANAEERIAIVNAWMGAGHEISDNFADEVDGARPATLHIDGMPAILTAEGVEAYISGLGPEAWDLAARPENAMQDSQTAAWAIGDLLVDPWDLGANPTPAVADAQTAVADIGAMAVPVWVLNADGSYALVDADAASREIGQKTPPPWDVDANTDKALGSADTAVGKINDKTATIKVDAVQSGNFLGNVQGMVNRIANTFAPMNVSAVGGNTKASHQANGSVLEFFANGGMRESHVAQIAPAGAMRVWAEPETGGEAYIPLAESKRSRSVDIWRETGKRLGQPVQEFASGGIVGLWQQRLKNANYWAKQARGWGDDAAVKRAEERAREAEAALKSLTAERDALKRSTRRGQVTDQATSGLSGAYSVVDQLWDSAKDDKFTKTQRDSLWKAAASAEPAMKRLYGQAEKLEKSLATARDRARDLAQIKANVSSVLSGEFSLEGATKQNTNSRGDIWYTTGSIGANAKATAARVQAFAGKLSRLQKMGLSGGVLQELAQMGSVEGSIAADALLAGGKSEIGTVNKAFSDIEKWSGQAGQYVTEGFYKGGVEAANGLVKGLESQQKAIEDQILKVAKGMEKALKQALGIKSPSKVTTGIGAFTGEGLIVGMKAKRRAIEDEATAMGLAAIPGVPLGASSASLSAASSRYSSSSAPAVSVNATVDKGAMSDALNGVSMTLMVDGKPIKAIVHTELAESATSVSRGY